VSDILAAIAPLSNILWEDPLVRILAAVVAVAWFITWLLVRKKTP
jgi:hypothetical protein